MLFDTRKLAIFILPFLLNGCLESEVKSNEDNTPSAVVLVAGKNIKRAYLPFKNEVSNRDSITFFQTEGTKETTKKLYEKSSNNPDKLTYNILQNFTVLGNFIYYDYVDSKTSNASVHIRQLRTSVKENTTIVSEEIEASNKNNPKINRIKKQNQLYVQSINNDLISTLTKYDINGSIFPILTNFPTTTSLTYHPLQILNDELYMLAKDKINNYIVHFNQNEHNNSLFKLNPKLKPLEFYTMNNRVYLLFYNNDFVPELWSFNPENNKMKQHFVFNSFSVNPNNLSSITAFISNNKLYLSFPQGGTELYVFDSNNEKIEIIFKESVGFIDTFIAYKHKVYFTASSTPSLGFWETEGTSNTTRQLKDEKNNPLSAKNLALIHNKLYFTHYRQIEGEELWVFDGDKSKLLLDINRGTGSSYPQYMTELNEGFVFQASLDGQNNKLFYFDDINLTALN